MEEVVFKAQFEGDYADENKVPAYNAVHALYGISRGIIIPSHYLLEGKVRHRNISSEKYELFLKPPQKGSFEALLELCFVAGSVIASNPLAVSISANLITETVMTAVKMTIGRSTKDAEKELTEVGIPPGDLGAIAAAIEPALRQSHTIINNGVVNINLISSAGGSVTLDQSSKNYINTIRNEGTRRVGLLSVGRYDANSRTGGAFDPQEGRIIPFSVRQSIDRESIATILRSQSDYALGMFDPDVDGSYVAFLFERVVDIDGTVKRIEVFKVRNNIDDL
ncbi:MAG: hypothetical protein IE925_16115 [Rhodobacterales bacterium]|nr:hypothetical protein [Rhodobacterales bacterium]